MTRLFLAVWPPDEVTEELRALRRKDQRGVRFMREETWHITLRFLGEAQTDDVVEAMRGVAFQPATAVLGPGVDLLFDRVLVVPVAGLEQLAATVSRATATIGEPPRKRFVGHLTLAKVKPRVAMPPALGALVDADFTVDEVALVRSSLRRDGARYETIETWPVPTAG